jgi:lipoprotein-anchoring transpeptidase ErfK/SrfK
MQFKRKWAYMAIVPVIAAAIPGVSKLIGGRDSTSATQAVSNLRLVADLSESRLKMYEADTLVWQYPISPGTSSHPTPPGTYTIRLLVWNPSWTPPPDAEWAKKYTPKEPGDPMNPMKVVKIFFKEPDYYIHGTAEKGRLGAPASHGCLRMDPEHVAEVAKFVMEHGGQPREESWFWRVLHFRSEEKPIYLKNPVPLTVTGEVIGAGG